MAPAKGNKHAVGHGRPPNPGFEDKDLIKLGEEMLAWMKTEEDNDKIVHLSQFYSQLKGICLSQWTSIIERSCFLGYYEKAREWMGHKIMRNQKLPTAYGSRFLSMYLKDLRLHEREVFESQIDYEVEKRSKLEAAKTTPPNNDQIQESIKAAKREHAKDKRIAELEALVSKLKVDKG